MQSAMIRENSMLYEEARDHIIKLKKLNMAKPVPMDVSGLERGGDGQPWAGGGDGGDQGQGQWDVDAVRNSSGIKCYACGKYGHMARDCVWDRKKIGSKGKDGKGGGQWNKGGKQGKGNPGGGKGGGKGKDGKGKGKGKGPQCWTCGGWGHKSDRCPGGKGVNALEGEQAETDQVEIGTVWECAMVVVQEDEEKGTRLHFESRNGFGELSEEDEEEEEEDEGPPSMVDSSESEGLEWGKVEEEVDSSDEEEEERVCSTRRNYLVSSL